MKSDPGVFDFSRLYFGQILGVVDSHGAVHSKFTGEIAGYHRHYFPVTHCNWRWNFRDNITWINQENKPTEQEYDAIQRHLTRHFGLQWWENGHFDIDHLQAQFDREGIHSCRENTNIHTMIQKTS